jgi:hypothetical protein
MKPLFQKRHYEAIALVAQDTIKFELANPQELNGAYKLLRELARSFKRDNLLFNTERFLGACQPGANVRARGTS